MCNFLRIRLVPLKWLLSIGLFAALTTSPLSVLFAADEEAVVAADEELIVGADDDEVVGDEDESSLRVWPPLRLKPRELNGHKVYFRQTSDAFVDPDKPMELEITYCFLLGTKSVHVSESLSRGKDPKKDLARLQVALPLKKELGEVSRPSSNSSAGAVELEWVNYNGIKLRKKIAVLRFAAGDEKARLAVYRAGSILGSWRVNARLATRTFPVADLPQRALPGGLLDTWDIPAGAGTRAGLYGRVIAVLKHIDGRYAVDFYGEALHKDSDCRVWLSRGGHPWGAPVAIRFIKVPIRKPTGNVASVAVLAVEFEDKDGQRTPIAIEYPLCRPVLIQQMQALADRLASSSKNSPPPDLAKLLGEDLLDELSRRLVNGNYR